LEEAALMSPERAADLLALDEALDELATIDARRSRVVELLAAVEVKTDPAFEIGMAKPLFEFSSGARGYDVSADGSRFLVNVPQGEKPPPS
jgi:hypothetical protein